MSPVEFHPAGSDPDQPRRVPIAGPDVPTAASFAAAGRPGPMPEPAAPVQRRRRRLFGWSHEPTSAPDPQPSGPPPPEPEAVEPEPVHAEAAERARPRRTRTLYMSAPPVGPPDEADPETADPELPTPVAEESGDATITGHVVSTRGRGLSGVSLVVVDLDDRVVDTTVTVRRGQFVIENLPGGTYRVGARDGVDGDFIDSWHGGEDADGATELRLDAASTASGADITLISRVAIDATVEARSAEIGVDVEILDRSTGLPAEGSVVISTDRFRTQLPLTDGHATLALFGSPAGDDPGAVRLPGRLRVEYTGSQHSGPATRTIRLR